MYIHFEPCYGGQCYVISPFINVDEHTHLNENFSDTIILPNAWYSLWNSMSFCMICASSAAYHWEWEKLMSLAV